VNLSRWSALNTNRGVEGVRFSFEAFVVFADGGGWCHQ
jgi:hypothetical protein